MERVQPVWFTLVRTSGIGRTRYVRVYALPAGAGAVTREKAEQKIYLQNVVQINYPYTKRLIKIDIISK